MFIHSRFHIRISRKIPHLLNVISHLFFTSNRCEFTSNRCDFTSNLQEFTSISKNSHQDLRTRVMVFGILFITLPGFSFLHLGNFMKVMIWLPPEIQLFCKNYTSEIMVSHWFYKVSCQCKNTLPKRCVRNGFPYFFLNFSPKVLQKHKICQVL